LAAAVVYLGANPLPRRLAWRFPVPQLSAVRIQVRHHRIRRENDRVRIESFVFEKSEASREGVGRNRCPIFPRITRSPIRPEAGLRAFLHAA
jgi:hypothetical protein